MYFRITKYIHVHIGFLVLLAFSFFISAGTFFRLTFLFAFLHELFHLAAAFFLHVPVLHFSFLPYGCHLCLGKTDFLSETQVAAAGPLGSFLLFLLSQDDVMQKINLFLCVINLLPALPLDGGRLLRLLLWKTQGVRRGNRLLRFTGFSTGLLFLGYGLFSRSFPSFYIAFLLFSHTKTSVFPLVHKKAARTPLRLYAVWSTDSLHLLLRLYSPFYSVLFYIRDRETFLPEETALRILSQNAAATFSDALQRSSRLN